MKKMIGALVLASMALVGLEGCGFIQSAQGGNTTQTGEAWYVKSTCLGPLLCFSTDVYYCDGKGPSCKVADQQ